MHEKTCIALALGVLLLALAGGNPFLCAPAAPAAPAEPIVLPVSLRAGDGRYAVDAVGMLPCPWPELQALVVAVHRAPDGTAVWRLRDGRELRAAADVAAAER
ncbi:MAG: hypothetical protein JNL08_11065 [Planctomycetes bacterium]|nr:hypothetical protein [Planctomycetota bacterium]